MVRAFAFGCGLMLALTSVGEGGPPLSGSPGPAHLQTDAEIKTAIVKGVVANPDVFAASLVVLVQEGSVILRGEVRTAEAKRAAEKIARQAPGVHSVRNQLAIAPVVKE